MLREAVEITRCEFRKRRSFKIFQLLGFARKLKDNGNHVRTIKERQLDSVPIIDTAAMAHMTRDSV